MKHPISLNLKKQFPDVRERDGVPADFPYNIPYAQKKCWQNDIFKLSQQDFDSKDTYFNLIQIKTKKRVSYVVKVLTRDLFWFYVLEGGVKFELLPEGSTHKGFIDELEADQYALFYNQTQDVRVTLEPGKHILFFFIVDAIWLQRHPIIGPEDYKELIELLKNEADTSHSTKVLTIRDAIRTELLLLFTHPLLEGIEMDAAAYPPKTRLIRISKKDLHEDNTSIDPDMVEKLIQIRRYVKEQIEVGSIPPINEIADHYKIPIQQIQLKHAYTYGHTLQSYITRKRLQASEKDLINTDKSISDIAYTYGYELNTYQKQFRTHYNMSPSEYRKRFKKK